MDKIITKTLIRNAKWLDFVRSIAGIITLLFMFIILCHYGIDGYLIYAVVTYTAFLSGAGWGLFFSHDHDFSQRKPGLSMKLKSLKK